MKIFNAISSGLSLGLLYVFAVFISPIIMMFLNYTKLTSKPTFLGLPLFKIQIHEHSFNSEATAFGFILSLIIGIAFYYLIQKFILSGKKVI